MARWKVRAPEERIAETSPDARAATYSSMRDFVIPALKLPSAFNVPKITPTTCVHTGALLDSDLSISHTKDH